MNINSNIKSKYTPLDGISTEVKEKYSSEMKDIQVKYNIDFLKLSNHTVKTGIVASFQNFKPQVNYFEQKENSIEKDSLILNKIDAVQTDIFIEDNWEISKNIQLFTGLRFSSFSPNNQKIYSNLEPRISAKFNLNKKISVSLGYSKMVQYLHLLSNNDAGIPKDLWVPSTEKIRPENADQYEIETTWRLNDTYNITINAYYKKLHNLIDYRENITAIDYWEETVEAKGKGTNKGIEIMFAKDYGRINGYISYVLSKSDRQFEHINKGKVYPFKFDYRNQINIVMNYKISNNASVVATWSYHTGNAITLAFEKYPVLNDYQLNNNKFGEAHIYKERNSYRMPAYHRLDIGLNVKQSRGEWHLGLYNAYNRMNPYYYYISKKGDKYVMKQKTMFPILPSISYSYLF